jgi:hypothetical protein
MSLDFDPKQGPENGLSQDLFVCSDEKVCIRIHTLKLSFCC